MHNSRKIFHDLRFFMHVRPFHRWGVLHGRWRDLRVHMGAKAFHLQTRSYKYFCPGRWQLLFDHKMLFDTSPVGAPIPSVVGSTFCNTGIGSGLCTDAVIIFFSFFLML